MVPGWVTETVGRDKGEGVPEESVDPRAEGEAVMTV